MNQKDDLGEIVKEWKETAKRMASEGTDNDFAVCADQLEKALKSKMVVDREDLEELIKSCDPYEFNIAMREKYLPKEPNPDPIQCAHGYVLTGDCPKCPKGQRILPKGK